MNSPRSFLDLFGPVPPPTPRRTSVARLAGPPPPADLHLPPRPNWCADRFDERFVFWGMRNMPVREAAKHLLILGAIGAGKTTAIGLFLQSIAPRFFPNHPRPEQLIIFDAKCDILPTLAGLGLDESHPNFWLLNPFDSRCAVWDLAAACQVRSTARYIATMLVPQEEKSTAPFFASAARDLLVYVMWGLNERVGKRWTLRDLLCASDSMERITKVTAWHPRGSRLAASIIQDDRHAFGAVATLSTKLSRFEEVAALWYQRPDAKRFSIDSFLSQPGVLVLSWDPVLNESLWPLNAILLKALTDEILRGPRRLQPRHWFVFDEFRAMENVNSIHNLLNRGRDKGASAMISLQSIEGLVDVYGEHKAEDILSACASKTFLRLGDPKSAGWAERYIGQVRRIEPVLSYSHSSRGESSISVQENLVDRNALLASYFMTLPFTGPGRPYKAVHDIPWLNRTIITQHAFDDVNGLRLPDKDVPAFVPREDPQDQILTDWTPDEEMLFLGTTAKTKRKSANSRRRLRLPKRRRNDEPPTLRL